MPKQRTVERARAALRAGKSASIQAGEYVREPMRTTGRGAARSRPHPIAIGLFEEGMSLPSPRPPPRKSRLKRVRPKVTALTAEPLEHEMVERPAKRRRPPARAKAVSPRRKKTAAKRVATKRRTAPKRRTPGRPAAKRRTPGRPAAKRRTPGRPAVKRRTPARPAAKRRTPTRPAATRRAPPKRAARRQTPLRPATRRLVPGRRPTAAKPITARQAAAAKKAVAKRLARHSPAARKGRRPHKRSTTSKTIWSFDL
jgi:hypothetical protein